MRPSITAVDVFCGIGGLTHGLIRGGVRVAAGMDVDPACRFAYESNNPRATFVECDVRSAGGAVIREWWAGSRFSLLAGCAPCQPFSTYSRRGRVRRQDEAWALVSEFGRLIREAQPDLVTMENVPQLEAHSVFRGFLDALDGYHVWHDTVDCTRYGVPQTRKRLVLLASRLGPVSLSERSVRTQKGASTVRQAICHLSPLQAGASDPRDPLHKACKLSPLNLTRIRASRPGGTWREWDSALVTRCHRDRSGETYPSVYGRMEWDAPAPTITTQCFGYGNGRFGHPEQDRAITLREAAILQTFPEGYRFVPPGSPVRFSVLGRLIGNAVPVRLGEVVARTMVKHVQAFS